MTDNAANMIKAFRSVTLFSNTGSASLVEEDSDSSQLTADDDDSVSQVNTTLTSIDDDRNQQTMADSIKIILDNLALFIYI